MDHIEEDVVTFVKFLTSKKKTKKIKDERRKERKEKRKLKEVLFYQ